MKKYGYLLFLACFYLAACTQAEPPPTLSPVKETPATSPIASVVVPEVPEIVTLEPTPTRAVCTPLPDDMTLNILYDSDRHGVIEVEGLQPGEKPIILIIGDALTGSFREETTTTNAVGADGRFQHKFDFRRWESVEDYEFEGQLIHQRGVACMEITLPLEVTAVPIDSAAIQTGAPILFLRDNDLWRADLGGQNEQRLTEGQLLADWGIDKLPAYDPWWAGGFPPHIHVSPNGRWLAFTQTGNNLVVIDITGIEQPRTHKIENGTTIFTWSPDSHVLAFGRTGIDLYDVLTDQITTLLDRYDRVVLNPVWSPDGRFLAFACCFVEPDPYEGIVYGEVRQMELVTRRVTTVGETWAGVASGTPSVCWGADDTVGIEVAEPVSCSFDPQAMGSLLDDTRYAYFFIQSPDDEEYFRWLAVKDQASDAILWEREVPLVQRVHWFPDGQYLILGNDFFAKDAAIYQIPADGTGDAQLIVPQAILLQVISAWE